MDFCLKIIDTVCKVRDKNNRPDFILGYRFSHEEPFDDGKSINSGFCDFLAMVSHVC